MKSCAQELPSHIIENIVFYFSGDLSAIHKLGSLQPPLKRNLLLPLMHVCKKWNETVSSIFYVSAYLVFNSKVAPPYLKEKDAIAVVDLIDLDKMRYLKTIECNISSTDFLNVEQSVLPIKIILDRYGPLLGVASIDITIGHDGTDGSSELNSLPNTATHSGVDLIDMNIMEYTKYFNALLPNRRAVRISNGFVLPTGRGNRATARYVFDRLPSVIGSGVRYLTSMRNLSKPFYKYLSATSPTRISLWRQGNSGLLEKLLRKVHATCESIELGFVDINCVANMIHPDDDGNAPVYYCLKNFRTVSLKGVLKDNEWHISNNPFPVLENFTCDSNFPFNSHTVLQNLKSYLRVLKISVDANMLEKLNKHHILDTASFKSLKVASLEWTAQRTEISTSHANQIFIKALNLSPSAHTVINRNLPVDRFSEQVLPHIIFSDCLRVIDLRGIYLASDDLMQLLSGFKNLYEARIDLSKESTLNRMQMPSPFEFEEFQKRFKSRASSIQLLKIVDIGDDNEFRLAGSIAMIVDVLPSLRRVVIDEYDVHYAESVLRKIKYFLSYSVFQDNSNLQMVKFM